MIWAKRRMLKPMRNSISSMEWKRVTPEILNQITAGKVILCRLHKYRNTLSNDKAYNMLDLPIYRQYFFIQGGLIDLPEELVALASAETATETPVLESSWVESEATEKTKQESAALTQGGGEGGSAQGVAGSMGAQAKAAAKAAAAAAAVAAASENSGLTEEEVKEAVETGLLLAAAKKEEEEKKKSAQFAADVFGQSEEEQQEKASFALSIFGGDQSYDT